MIYDILLAVYVLLIAVILLYGNKLTGSLPNIKPTWLRNISFFAFLPVLVVMLWALAPVVISVELYRYYKLNIE